MPNGAIVQCGNQTNRFEHFTATDLTGFVVAMRSVFGSLGLIEVGRAEAIHDRTLFARQIL